MGYLVSLACLALLIVTPARAAGDNPADAAVLRPDATVIVDAGASEAATLLHDYLRRATGSEDGFKVLPAGEADRLPADTFVIAVGPSRWVEPNLPPDLARDGYVVRRTGNVIAICGGSERGTLHGAAGFLDRFAGVRFYMPTDLWTSLPADRKVAVPAAVDIRDEPFSTGTSFSQVTGPEAGAWNARNAAQTRSGLAGTHQHNMNNVFPPERFAQRYPELYPIIDGERYLPKDTRDQNWNPCFTSEQTLEAAEEMALEHFARNPDDLWFSMGLQDSHTHCECEGCLRAFADLERECIDNLRDGNPRRLVSTYTATPEASVDDTRQPTAPEKWARPYALSQLQWRLVNRLAQRLEKSAPNKFVEAMTYGVTSFAPTFELHPQAMVFMQIHVSDNVRGLMEPRADGTIPLDAFLDASPRAIGNHEWYRGEGYMVPRIYSRYWTRFLRHLQSKAAPAQFHHVEAYSGWGMDGLKYWVLTQSLWDPGREPEALWRQACTDLFGDAAEQMVAYFQTLEDWHSEQSVERGAKWKIGGYDGVFRRPASAFRLMHEARGHLDAAKARADRDEVRQRIALFDKTFHLTEEFAAIAVAATEAADATPGDARAKDAAVEQATGQRAAALLAYFDEHIRSDPMTLAPRMREREAFENAVYRVQFGRTKPKEAPLAPDGENP